MSENIGIGGMEQLLIAMSAMCTFVDGCRAMPDAGESKDDDNK